MKELAEVAIHGDFKKNTDLLLRESFGQRSYEAREVSRRYEKGSIIITSNESYGDRGTLFLDGIVASAIRTACPAAPPPLTSEVKAIGCAR